MSNPNLYKHTPPPKKLGKVSPLVYSLRTVAKDATPWQCQAHLTQALQFQTLTASACPTQPRNIVSVFCSFRTADIKTTLARTMNTQPIGSSVATIFRIPKSMDTSVTDPTFTYKCITRPVCMGPSCWTCPLRSGSYNSRKVTTRGPSLRAIQNCP